MSAWPRRDWFALAHFSSIASWVLAASLDKAEAGGWLGVGVVFAFTASVSVTHYVLNRLQDAGRD